MNDMINLRLVFRFLLLTVLIIACNISENLPLLPHPTAPIIQSPATGLSVEPLPTATSLPPPTPTPIPAVRIRSGDQAYQNGDWDLAEIEYQAAYQTSNDPEIKIGALLGLGRAQHMKGDAQQAVTTLEI